jgi:hypothetical protein
MLLWFLLAGNEPEKLTKKFSEFFSDHSFPAGVALWRWKKTCWICAPEMYRHDILSFFVRFGIIEFSSAPSPSDIEFLHGDINALNPLARKKPPLA